MDACGGHFDLNLALNVTQSERQTTPDQKRRVVTGKRTDWESQNTISPSRKIIYNV